MALPGQQDMALLCLVAGTAKQNRNDNKVLDEILFVFHTNTTNGLPYVNWAAELLRIYAHIESGNGAAQLAVTAFVYISG